MNVATSPQRRNLLVAMAAVGMLPLAGCMSKPLRPVNADGTYCHRIGKSYRPTLTCTPAAVPTDAVEAEAKRFEPDPASLTVYVMRRRWADAQLIVPVAVDATTVVSTIPNSLVRLRLKSGSHRLSAQWDGRSVDFDVAGRAGDLRLIELVGSDWAWGTRFSWARTGTESAVSMARSTKLIADYDLRR